MRTPFPAFGPEPLCRDCSVIRSRGWSPWLGGEKNDLRRMWHGSARLVRPNAPTAPTLERTSMIWGGGVSSAIQAADDGPDLCRDGGCAEVMDAASALTSSSSVGSLAGFPSHRGPASRWAQTHPFGSEPRSDSTTGSGRYISSGSGIGVNFGPTRLTAGIRSITESPETRRA